MKQALDAPWPIIQANAIYLASSMLSLSDDQRILILYYAQIFTTTNNLNRKTVMGFQKWLKTSFIPNNLAFCKSHLPKLYIL